MKYNIFKHNGSQRNAKKYSKKEYRNLIDQEIKVLVNKYNLKIRLEDPIYHNEKS